MNETPMPISKHNPALGIHGHVRRGNAGSAGSFAGVNLFDQVPAGGGDHGGNGEQEAELERRGPVEAGQSGRRRWSTWSATCRERWPRASGRDRSRWPAEASSLRRAWCSAHDASLQASTTHITMPPTSSAMAMALRLPRFFSLHLRSSRAGTEVKAKAMSVSEMGWVSQVAVAVFAVGKGAQKFDDPLEKQQAQRENGAYLDDDRVHLPVGHQSRRNASSGLRRCAGAPLS